MPNCSSAIYGEKKMHDWSAEVLQHFVSDFQRTQFLAIINDSKIMIDSKEFMICIPMFWDYGIVPASKKCDLNEWGTTNL